MRDEGFHEIQLNGKQLVFLFMAATVVSVVIFLCGVMVGRGVQTARATESTTVPSQAELRPVETGRGDPAPATVAPEADPEPVEDDYYGRLVEGKPSESLAPSTAVKRTESAPVPVTPPTTSRATTGDTAPRSAAAPPSPPAGDAAVKPKPQPATQVAAGATSGFAVQLAALRERNEAEAIAKRLVAKGYQAYVLVPAPGAPPVYRVQVGRFGSRGEADRVAARLKKEERFDPWVTAR